jgi:O-antigen/teichoic acid export membrane protein
MNNIKYHALIERFLEKIYLFLFQKKPGETSLHLLRNIFYNISGVIGGTLITFIFSIWAVRLMGPQEYGKANIVISTASFLVIFLLFGLTNSAMRYLSREKESRGEILGSIIANVLILSAIFLPLFWITRDIVTKLFNIEPYLFLWAIGYAIVICAIYLSETILQGLDKFKTRAILTAFSAIFFSSYIAIYGGIFHTLKFEHYLTANILRWLAVIILAIFTIFPLIKYPSFRWMKETLHFGIYHMGMYLAGFFLFFSIDTLMLNYYRGSTQVGLYGAYFITFNAFVSKLFQPMIDAFYTSVSAIDDTRIILNRVLEGSKKFLPIVFISGIFLTAILFMFYGKEYPFSWNLAVLMSLNTSLYIASNLMASIIGSRGIKGARFLLIAVMLAAIVNVTLNTLLIPKLDIAGVMLATTGAFLTLFITYWSWLRTESDKTSR